MRWMPRVMPDKHSGSIQKSQVSGGKKEHKDSVKIHALTVTGFLKE